MQPTQWQIGIAGLYHIPRSQAHTINGQKVAEYLKFKRSPAQRLEHWLDVYCGRERCDTTMIMMVNENSGDLNQHFETIGPRRY